MRQEFPNDDILGLKRALYKADKDLPIRSEPALHLRVCAVFAEPVHLKPNLRIEGYIKDANSRNEQQTIPKKGILLTW